jgi:uncharacterized membrane protein
MPMPAPSLPLFYAVSPTAPATVTASSSSTTQSDVLPLMTDLTHAEIERRLGKRSVIDSSLVLLPSTHFCLAIPVTFLLRPSLQHRGSNMDALRF